MFNEDFYPTPNNLIERLIDLGSGGRLTIRGARRILEPSAGKGNIINYINNMGYKPKIDAIEKDMELSNLLSGAGHNVVWNDFLSYETHREYDVIIMNPPFSEGDKHLLYAIELAKKQITKKCSIYAIINAETIRNPYSNSRKVLARELELLNADIEFVQDAFSNAERKTNVEVALINLEVKVKDNSESIYKQIINNVNSSSNSSESISTALSTVVEHQELADRVSDIERLVLEYEKAASMIKDYYKAKNNKESFMKYISNVNNNEFYVSTTAMYDDYEKEIDSLRSSYWKLILRTGEFMKKLTTEAREKLARQLEEASELEINYTNIQMLLHAVLSNSNQMLIDSIVSMFDKITKRSQTDYSSNIHLFNGWKTNDAFKINKKIIYPFYSSWDIYDMGKFTNEDYSKVPWTVKDFISDLVKAFEPFRKVDYEFVNVGKAEYENDILKFKMFAKGTIHVWFKDLDTLNKINYVAGKHFKWLPTDDELKTNKKAQEYVYKEYGNILTDVNLLLEQK